jgi:nucleotide-binding universal stress UspA family protein
MKTILVGMDGSPHAPRVLARAIALAQAEGGRIVLVRAIGLVGDVAPDLWHTTDAPLIDVLNQRAAEYLSKFEAIVPASLRAGTRVVVGAPWEAICLAAKSLEADLVVIGSHGYSGIDRLIGTTAAKVVNHSPCSVLVVKGGPANAAGSPPNGSAA